MRYTNYVDKSDYAYKSEKGAALQPGPTFTREGFTALHMFSVMLRFIFPVYQESLSYIGDNNLVFKAQMEIVSNISNIVHAKTDINVIAKMREMIKCQMAYSEKKDQLVWNMANMVGSGALHVELIEILFKRLCFNSCLKINLLKGNAVSFIYVTINNTMTNNNRANFPIKCHEVSTSTNSTVGVSDDDDDPFERLMNQFNGVMGIPDETIVYLQDILVRENIQRFLRRIYPGIDIEKIEKHHDYYLSGMHSSMRNNSFVTKPQQHIVSLLAYKAFAGTNNIVSMAHSDYIYLAMGSENVFRT